MNTTTALVNGRLFPEGQNVSKVRGTPVVLLLFFFLYFVERKRKSASKFSKKALQVFSEVPSVPIFGPILHLLPHKSNPYALGLDWIKHYGRCWRIKVFGMDIVAIHDPALLKPILESRDVGCLSKPFIYDVFAVGPFKTGIFTKKAEPWAPHRRSLNAFFTYEALKNYVSIVDKHANTFVNNIAGLQSNPTGLTLRDVVYSTTMDVIAEIIIGRSLESVLGRDNCQRFHKSIESFKQIMSNRAFKAPWQLFPWIWHFHPMKKELDKVLTSVGQVGKQIRESYVPQKDFKFVADVLILENKSDEEITTEILHLFVAGHDTVSFTLVAHLFNMALEQKHQLACRQEVDEMFDKLAVSREKLDMNAINGLKHVDLCVKETMRMFPALAFGTGRDLKTRVHLTKDVYLEPGTKFTYIPYLIHRNPELYPNPDEFDPSRFLPENAIQRSPYAYLPFSAGPRNCIGWKVAMLELKVYTAFVLRNFELSTTDNREDIKVEFELISGLSKIPNVTFKKRVLCINAKKFNLGYLNASTLTVKHLQMPHA